MSRSGISRWSPLLMSALAYPGAGQFMQKRKFWGLVYAIAFTLFTAIFLALLMPPLWRMIDSAFAGRKADPIPWPAVLRPLAVATAVYIANIYDAWWHTIRPTPPPIPPGHA